jgi:predicted O-methyltransferase YrrM
MNKKEILNTAMSFGFGGMQRSELELLYDVCKDKNVLELGSHIGQSSYVIASVAKHLTCVDAWIDGAPYLDDYQKSIYEKQEKNMEEQFDKNTKCYTNITKIKGLTSEVHNQVSNDFDIILFDADHSYDGVALDIKLYSNKAPVLIFHDYNTETWVGVTKAVKEQNYEHLKLEKFLLICRRKQ